MKDPTEYFIDLSKCSKVQLNYIFLITKISEEYIDYTPYLYLNNDKWSLSNGSYIMSNNLTELTYPEFIKLFEGGEDNNGWIKIESKSQYDLLENGEYHWYNINTGRYDKGDLWEFGTFTHYQPIVKPEPPKF